MEKKTFFIALVCMLLIFIMTHDAMATQGYLQTVTRPGFWGTDFPDQALFVQDISYYWTDTFRDKNGNKVDTNDTKVTITLTRLVKVWHLDDSKQFQYLLLGGLMYENISVETGNPATSASISGLADPFTLNAIGWHSKDNNKHISFALVNCFPVGDHDLKSNTVGGDAFKAMPILAYHQRFGSFLIEGAVGYLYNFDDLKDDNTHGRNQWEFNVMPSFRFGKWGLYMQGDYTISSQSKYYGKKQDDDGYNITAAAGISYMFTPTIELNFKYDVDVDGKSELQGQGLNLRLFVIF